MAEENTEESIAIFQTIMRDVSKRCGDALAAKRLGNHYQTIECLRRALEHIGRAFLHA